MLVETSRIVFSFSFPFLSNETSSLKDARGNKLVREFSKDALSVERVYVCMSSSTDKNSILQQWQMIYSFSTDYSTSVIDILL